MNARSFRAALRQMPLVPPAAFGWEEPTLILSPHPDDETLGLGGLVAATGAAGGQVHVVILTDGAGSHRHSVLYPPDRLKALRRQETAAATRLLGLPESHLTHLDYPDAHLPTSGADFEDAVERIALIARSIRARRVLVTWRFDPHCDHEAAAAMARALRVADPTLKLWSYPIWGWHLDGDTPISDPSPQGFRLDIAPWLAVKRQAIDAYASQMTDLISDDPTGFHFTPETLAPFLAPVETVFAVPL